MKKINNEHFFLFVLLLAIFPYCYLSFFANPSADDFSLASLAQQNDLLELFQYNYFYRTGRYVSNLLIFLNPIAFGNFVGYKLVSLLMIFLIFFANFTFVNQLFYKNTKQKNGIIALVFSLLFIHNMPIISEGIYWFTGSVIYTLGLIVSLFYFSLLIKVIRDKKKRIYAILLTLILFLSCGFNEVLTLLMVFFLAVLSFIFYTKDLPGKKTIIFQLFFSILFLGIVVFSPGNEIRGGAYNDSHNLIDSFAYSILQVGRFSFIWVTSIPLLAASLIYFQINKQEREKNELFKNSFYINRWVSLVILFAIIFICVFPAYWSTGILGQHRTLNVAYFFFIIMWFVNLTVWFNYYQQKIKFGLTKKILLGLSIFLLVGIVFTGNGYNNISDILSGSAKNYDKQLTARFKILKDASQGKKDTVIISPLKNRPKCLFVSEITNDPNDWSRNGVEVYFNVKIKLHRKTTGANKD